MAIGNHYIQKHFQSFGAQEVLNVYAYEQTSGGGAAPELNAAFVATLLPLIEAIQSIAVAEVRVETYNVETPSDFDVLALTGTGSQAGECLPPFAAYSIILRRATRASRNGWKRICGVPEAQQNNGALSSAIITQGQILADAMAASFTDGSGNAWAPRIWRRLSATHAEAFFGISSAQIQGNVTTQNTRKFGRGA